MPKDVIYREGDSNISNDELRVEFCVPATIGTATPTIKDGSVVENADRIGFYFGVETAPIDNRKAILFREGVPVREYVCDVSWDWNLGYAGIDFGENINFENGVKYSVQLPEGSVSALLRPDIVNEKAEVSFVGGYREPVKPIQYTWCSLYDHHPTDVLGEVKFFYNQPVVLSANPLVMLYNEEEKLIVKEVVPIISEEKGKWVLIADFEKTPLVSKVGYSIIIPEGTLVTKEGDVIVNQHNVMSIGNATGIAGNENAGVSISVGHGIVTIEHDRKKSDIKLFSLDGKMIISQKSSEKKVSILVPAAGIYLLSINGTIHKIAVE